MTDSDVVELIGYLMGSFAIGITAGYVLAAFKMAAKSSSR